LLCCCCRSSYEEFFAGFQISSPCEDTCAEIYKSDGDGNYEKVLDVGLHKPYETYQYVAALGDDLTGYFINSSRPIAVYAGHACAFVPEMKLFCDHMVEQIPPTSELGRQHIVPPIIGRADLDAGCVLTIQYNTIGLQYKANLYSAVSRKRIGGASLLSIACLKRT